ncbi:hypothetical protein ACWEKT_40860 [Nocardia takedensis]|uniref:hypothetical protein n=1 Tax=Nocardia takedensis TaxID=259390 RepID=UPI0012F6B6DD|nr:hypothetical protein [Nocardia takedensis]
MDPLTVVVTALTTGAAAGLSATASTAVSDAYQGLKQQISRLLGTSSEGDSVLAQHEADPETWHGTLEELLAGTDVASDAEVLAAATRLLDLTDPAGSRDGKYSIDAAGSNIANIGDHAQQINTFGAPPPPR